MHSNDNREVHSIVRAGLTNAPALTLHPVAASEEMGDAAETLETAEIGKLQSFVRQLLEAFAVDPKTPLQDALKQVLEARRDATEIASAMPLEAVANLLLSTSRTGSAKEVEQTVAAAMQAGQLPPALKDWGLQLCSADPKAFSDFVSRSPFAYLSKASALEGFPQPAKRDQTGTAASIGAQLGLAPDALDD